MAKIEDKNGFWFIEKNPITKVGVFPYKGNQISADCDPNRIYWVLRPKEELMKKETLDSLRLVPIVDGHTMIGEGFTAPEEKGIDGMLGDNVTHDTDTIYNDLKIVSNKMKDEIKNGKKELSLGYFCRYDKQPGTYKGQRYDFVQRDIKANHLALVERGRMGSDVRVYDSKEGGAFAMDSIDITMDKDEEIEWITVRGTHVPIKKGENKEQAVKNFLESKKQSSGNSEKDKDREYRNKLFKEATKRVEEKEKNKLQKEYEEIQKRQSERKDNENLSFKDKQFKDATKKVEQKRISEIEAKLGKQSGGENSKPEGKKTKEELTEKTTTTKNTSKEEMKIFVANKAFFDDRIKKPQDFKKELKNTFEEIYAEKTPQYYGKKERVATFEEIYEEAVSRYLKKNGNGQDSMEYKTKQGENKMAEENKKTVVADEDKRKLIDEIGGILKDKVSEEDWRTIVGKIEKVAYNASEADKGTDEDNVEETEEKDKKAAKDKCGKDEEKDEEAKKKEIVKEFAKKEKLAKEVEDALGTFDHSEMTELEVAKYACDKLELGAVEGQELATLKGYLKGIAKAPKTTYGYKTVAADSGIAADEEFEKFANKGE